MQLSDLIAMAASVDVHPERCIRAFSPRATCSKCVQLCPNGSIRIDGGVVSVDTCDGCGRCIQACPHDVFEMDFPAALKMPHDGPLIICCRDMIFPICRCSLPTVCNNSPGWSLRSSLNVSAKLCSLPIRQPAQTATSTGSRGPADAPGALRPGCLRRKAARDPRKR